MAKVETVVYHCDLHEGEFTEGVETVAFTVGGQAYEVDACEQHRDEMDEALAPYVGAARKAGASAPAPRRATRSSSRSASSAGAPSADRERVQAIREWARANGHAVSERGRLSASVLQAYEAAH
jgi:hypothetical protein